MGTSEGATPPPRAPGRSGGRGASSGGPRRPPDTPRLPRPGEPALSLVASARPCAMRSAIPSLSHPAGGARAPLGGVPSVPMTVRQSPLRVLPTGRVRMAPPWPGLPMFLPPPSLRLQRPQRPRLFLPRPWFPRTPRLRSLLLRLPLPSRLLRSVLLPRASPTSPSAAPSPPGTSSTSSRSSWPARRPRSEGPWRAERASTTAR